jgi:GLPGLI family protein
MKTTILLAAALVLSVAGTGQTKPVKITKSGKINYEERAKLEINLEGDEAIYADSFPKERVSNRVLYFNSDYSIYQINDSKKSNEVMRTQKSHSSVRMIASGEYDKIFIDIRNRKKVEQKEFMTRIFLIDEDINSPEWKLTGNSRTVLGYNCQEAVREDKGKKISAWFTSSIPVSTGPAGYYGLPGLVLLVDINNGKQTITATSIDPSYDDVSKLSMPKEGKKVTSEEYNKIVEEKLKEIRNETGGSSDHVMIQVEG